MVKVWMRLTVVVMTTMSMFQIACIRNSRSIIGVVTDDGRKRVEVAVVEER